VHSGKALVVVNLLKDDAANSVKDVIEELHEAGWTSDLFSFKGDPAGVPDFGGYNLIVCLGGDGTLLFVARIAAPLGIPILPVNLGTLGFIAANRLDSWKVVFHNWLAESIIPSYRCMLQVAAFRSNAKIGGYVALNDAVVSSQGIAKMIRLRLNVNNDCFGIYRADGLIVATPTGSTAYNLAAGGPAVHPEMPAMIINPICPFTLASRPLVLPASETVEVIIDETRRSGAMLTVDGQETLILATGDVVRIRRAEKDAMLLVPTENMFFSALRTKLGWSGDGHG
jgi:NAD+ kinase